MIFWYEGVLKAKEIGDTVGSTFPHESHVFDSPSAEAPQAGHVS